MAGGRGSSSPLRNRWPTGYVEQAAWLGLWGSCFAIVFVAPLFAVESSESRGSGNRSLRVEATRAIPWQQLDPCASAALSDIVAHPSIYRRLPVRFTECDPGLHHFLVRHPETLVSIWEAMGITNLVVERTGRTSFRADDGMGTKSQIELLYASPDVHIFYGTGYYEGNLLPTRVAGRGLVLLRSRVYGGPDGTAYVQDIADAFIKFDAGPLDLAAKTLHPLFMKYADQNFLDTMNFVTQLSCAARRQPQSTQQFAGRLRGLHPDVRQEFARVLQEIANSSTQVAAGPFVAPVTTVDYAATAPTNTLRVR